MYREVLKIHLSYIDTLWN